MVSEFKPKLTTSIFGILWFVLSVKFRFSIAFSILKFSNDDLETGILNKEIGYSKIGRPCHSANDCNFVGAICDDITQTCQCHPKFPVTNGIKCGKRALLNGSCEFHEECEQSVWNSMCNKSGICVCRGDGKPVRLADNSIKCEGKQFGDPCSSDKECAFKWAICDPNKHNCQCRPDLIATNHIDKCGDVKKINEECFFNEQCEQMLFDTICSNGKCSCRSERTPLFNVDGSIKCIVVEEPDSKMETDPTMIIVLSVMCLMFIIICVVLHLFSKARWRENRTIFNTPNPRLMNVSLLREKKSERRGSKEGATSIKGSPSRQASMASLRQQSPSIEFKNAVSRRESRGTSSNGSTKSPTNRGPSVATYCDTPFVD